MGANFGKFEGTAWCETNSLLLDAAVKLCEQRFSIFFCGAVLKATLITVRFIHSDD